MPRDEAAPLLTGVVVHWRNETELAELIASWPPDPRFELLVVDNSATADVPPAVRALRPARNLGFGGGANAGIAAARAPWVLLLNPDVTVSLAGLEALLAAGERFPEAAGIVPRLISPSGAPQTGWQLRRLPSPFSLLLQAFPGFRAGAPGREPAEGEAIEQPAAAALLLRKSAFTSLGGFDEAFFPAWFEDVDLAARLRAEGLSLRYWPAATFVHRLGSTVPRLGYGPFLDCYYRNLLRYLGKHHGRAWIGPARAAIAAGALLRLLALPLRRPARATSRRDALSGLLGLLRSTLGRRSPLVQGAPG